MKKAGLSSVADDDGLSAVADEAGLSSIASEDEWSFRKG